MFYVDKIVWPDADTETAYDSPHQTSKLTDPIKVLLLSL
jgi:hypothetical protein